MFHISYILDSSNFPQTETVTGFETGIIVFEIENLKMEIRSSMIFLTMAELISGLIEFKNMKLVYKEISAIDSSSYICIYRKKSGLVKLVVDNQFATINDDVLFKEALRTSYNFYNRFRMNLNQSIKHDLDMVFKAAELTYM